MCILWRFLSSHVQLLLTVMVGLGASQVEVVFIILLINSDIGCSFKYYNSNTVQCIGCFIDLPHQIQI